MKLTLTRRFTFSAGHMLHLEADHPCNRLHGHNYVVEVSLTPSKDLDRGMVMEASAIDSAVTPVIKRFLDHRMLNEIEGDEPHTAALREQPTVENLCAFLWWRLGFFNNSGKVKLARLRVYETERTWAEITP